MNNSDYSEGQRHLARRIITDMLDLLPAAGHRADRADRFNADLILELDKSKTALRELSNTFKFTEWDDNLYLPDAIAQLSKWIEASS